ncbi:MAG: protein arginine kinase [Pirellulales bacterium]
MNIDELTRSPGEWLKGSGPESDIVMSSRIRLARNLADFAFVGRLSRGDLSSIRDLVRARLVEGGQCDHWMYFDVEALDDLERQLFVERQLISREHAEAEGPRAVAVCADERASLMINEEDHLRVQVMHSGLDLESAWEHINAIDDEIEAHVTYAFKERLGYLTACPTNVGTGMRVSVMLHLPALVITRQIERVFRSLQKISLAVRGLYGEGSQAMGDFYQISNQITLGRSEQELVRQVGDVVPVIIQYERQAREALVREGRKTLLDRVSRAYGILRTAQKISSEETMHLLSSVRMGVNLGLIGDLEIATLNELFLRTQPAHLQRLSGSVLDTADRNIERARYLRHKLGGDGDSESE